MNSSNRLRCLQANYYDELLVALKSIDIGSVYGAGEFELDEARTLETPIQRVGPVPNLLEADGTTRHEHDGKNAILLHKHLPNISSAQGADRRLWTYLTHTDFFEYTKARWGIEGGKDHAKHIANRWFMRGGRAGLLGNAIARLWWGAHLTHAPWERDAYFAPLEKTQIDDYVYTRWLFDSQNMFQGLVYRRFGGSLPVRICMLEAFDRHARNHTARSALAEAVEKRLNLVSSYRVLSALPFEMLMTVMETHLLHAIDELKPKAA